MKNQKPTPQSAERQRRRTQGRQEGESMVFDKMELMGTVGMLRGPEEMDQRIQDLLGRLDELTEGRSPPRQVKQSVVRDPQESIEVIDAVNSFSLAQSTQRRDSGGQKSVIHTAGNAAIRPEQSLSLDATANDVFMTELAQLTAQNAALNQEAEGLQARVEQISEINEALVTERAQLQDQIEALEEKTEALQCDLDAARLQVDAQALQITDLTQQLEMTEREKQSIAEEAQQLREALEAQKKSPQRSVKDQEIVLIKQELLALQAQLKAQQQKATERSAELKVQQLDAQRREESLQQAEELLQQKQADLDTRQRIFQEQQAQLKRQQEQLQTQQTQPQQQQQNLGGTQKTLHRQPPKPQDAEIQKQFEAARAAEARKQTLQRQPQAQAQKQKSQIPAPPEMEKETQRRPATHQPQQPKTNLKSATARPETGVVQKKQVSILETDESMGIEDLIMPHYQTQAVQIKRPNDEEEDDDDEILQQINQGQKADLLEPAIAEDVVVFGEGEDNSYYPTNQEDVARPDLITSARSKWNRVEDEVPPALLDGTGFVQTPQRPQKLVSVHSAQRRQSQQQAAKAAQIAAAALKTPPSKFAAAMESQYTFDEQSFAFDVEVKKTPGGVAQERQKQFIQQQQQRAISAKLDAGSRLDQALTNQQKLEEQKQQLTQKRLQQEQSERLKKSQQQLQQSQHQGPTYIPRQSTDNSAQVRIILANTLLKGDANFEKRQTALSGIELPGHYVVILKDVERCAYHSVVRIDECGQLVKVAGPDNMPELLSQNIIDQMLKYNTTARQLEVVPMKQLTGAVCAVTLNLRKRK